MDQVAPRLEIEKKEIPELVVRARGRPTELDKRELKRLIPLMKNDEAKKLVEIFKTDVCSTRVIVFKNSESLPK